MKLVFLVYHDVLEDRIDVILQQLHIDAYSKWENVTGKSKDADPLLGTRTYPGLEAVKLIPFTDESVIEDFIKKIEEFNSKAIKSIDQARLYMLPLERMI
jgi:hypothetical protein